MINENFYKIIGILCICIILYYICNVYYNKKVDIKNINKKFKNNKKLDNINFTTINVKNNLINIAENKVITYINKYLEKNNKRQYNLEKQDITNIQMAYNKKVDIYKISFILDLKEIVVDILLYIDKKNTIFIRYINHIPENNTNKNIIYFELEDDLDIAEIGKDKKKLYYLLKKIQSMKKKGYEPIFDDNKTKKIIEKFINNKNNNLINDASTSINNNNILNNNINSNLFYPSTNTQNTFLDGTPLCDGCNKNSQIISIIGEPYDQYSQYSKI